jgi:hypothetical protein
MSAEIVAEESCRPPAPHGVEENPFSFEGAISAIGCTTPISLLALMIGMRIVLSVTARRRSSRLIRRHLRLQVGDAVAFFLSRLQVSMTALCSVTHVMMWFPFSRYISATPLIARLSDSVAPLVNTTSFAFAPISSATRAASPPPPRLPTRGWLRLAALPKCSVK